LYRIELTSYAQQQLLKHSDYYEKYLKGYGLKFARKLFQKINSLRRNPYQGRKDIYQGREVRGLPTPDRKAKFSACANIYS